MIKKNHNREVVDSLMHAVELAPTDIEIRIALVQGLLRDRQRDQASAQMQTILNAREVPSVAMASLGGLLVRSGEIDLALVVLSKALERSPELPQVHLELSRLQLARNDYESAIREAEKSVELAPVSLESKLALVEALISVQENTRHWNNCTRCDPNLEFHLATNTYWTSVYPE